MDSLLYYWSRINDCDGNLPQTLLPLWEVCIRAEHHLVLAKTLKYEIITFETSAFSLKKITNSRPEKYQKHFGSQPSLLFQSLNYCLELMLFLEMLSLRRKIQSNLDPLIKGSFISAWRRRQKCGQFIFNHNWVELLLSFFLKCACPGLC